MKVKTITPTDFVNGDIKYKGESVMFSNKKVTEADRKFVDKHILPHIQEEETFIQSWNGSEVETTPLIAALFHFIMNMSASEFSPSVLRDYGVSEGSKVQAFDRARYLILKLDKEVYMNFID